MSLYLVRHGETDYNRQKRIQGHEDIPMNSNGLAQAHATAAALKTVPFQRIICSPLQRAYNTAEIIASFHSGVSLEVDPDLIERDYGLLSGLTPQERELFARTGRPDLVESLEALQMRAWNVVRRYTSVDPVLLVSHGAWINSLVGKITDHQLGTGKTLLKNGSICVLDSDLSLLHYNLTPEEWILQNCD